MSPELFDLLWKIALWALGTGGVVYGLIQFLGKKWIDAKFAEKFADYQHEQSKELMRLRVKIDSLLDGALKRQAKEFETLPIAWQKLDEAFGLLQWITSPMQNYPPVEDMDDHEFDELLNKTEFLESQKRNLRKTEMADRMDAFVKQDTLQRFSRTQTAVATFETFITNNGLFFPVEIKEQLKQIAGSMWNIIRIMQLEIRSNDGKYWIQANSQLRDNVEPLYKAAETAIYARFHSHNPEDKADE